MKKDEDGIVFDRGAVDTKKHDWPGWGSKKEAIAELALS